MYLQKEENRKADLEEQRIIDEIKSKIKRVNTQLNQKKDSIGKLCKEIEDSENLLREEQGKLETYTNKYEEAIKKETETNAKYTALLSQFQLESSNLQEEIASLKEQIRGTFFLNLSKKKELKLQIEAKERDAGILLQKIDNTSNRAKSDTQTLSQQRLSADKTKHNQETICKDLTLKLEELRSQKTHLEDESSQALKEINYLEKQLKISEESLSQNSSTRRDLIESLEEQKMQNEEERKIGKNKDEKEESIKDDFSQAPQVASDVEKQSVRSDPQIQEPSIDQGLASFIKTETVKEGQPEKQIKVKDIGDCEMEKDTAKDPSFEEMYKTYLDSYKSQTVENPFFITAIPEQVKEEYHPDIRVGEIIETTPDGFVIKRGVTWGKPYIELDKYNGNAEVVEVPDYVTEISSFAEFTSESIKKIIIPSKVTGVNKRMFSKKVRENIADKDGLCIVGRFLVDYLGNARNVTIPEGVEVISYAVFDGNRSITTVYLPKSIKVIDSGAFRNCDHLSEVIFNSETEMLDLIGSAFFGCTSLTKINLPKTINHLAIDAFDGCNIPAISNKSNGFEIIRNILLRYTGNDTVVNVPEGITVIGDYAFTSTFQREQISKIVLPNGVKRIGTMAFRGLKALREISIPDSVETIESEAFAWCVKLSSVNLSGVTYIGANAFEHCDSLKDVMLSEKLEIISGSAFCSCDSLKTISIPGSVCWIGTKAFYQCSRLSRAVLQEGIGGIGSEAFSYTSSMVSINIPSSIKIIGRDAFLRCKCAKKIVFPEALNVNKAYFGIPDENNCFVENGILTRYDGSVKDGIARVSDGVVVVANGAFRALSGITQIILPDSVREIHETMYGGYSKKLTCRIKMPCGYFLQKRKLPLEPLQVLLRSALIGGVSMLDWVSIYIYQNNKQLDKYCMEAFVNDPNAFVTCALVILGDKCRSKDIDRIEGAIYNLRNDIGQEFLDKFYAFVKDKENKSKKKVSASAPVATDSVGGELDAKKKYKNDIEEFCDNNFEKHEFDCIMQEAGLKENSFEKSGVKYSDSGEDVSAFVLECAILPYVGQMTEKPRNYGSYRSDFSKFQYLEKSDQIASGFEKTSFYAFLDKFSVKANDYKKPQIWIPVCRFGNGDQVKALILKMNLWSNWGLYRASGRMAIMVCTGAIMLSDSREAMLYAEKNTSLNYYAELRGMTADTFRDTKLADFGFNSDGKKVFDLGNTIIEASIGDDLEIILFDTTTSKIVKSLPKKGCDAAKYDACSADYSDLKKNVKKVVKARNDMLFECFLSGKKFDCESWTAVYTNNPVLNKVAKLLVWSQGKHTFTLTEKGAVDSFGNSYAINPTDKIVVAHPLKMEDADIERWQKFFTERNLKQPFEQIWEPKIKDKIQENRYMGCMIPYYRFLKQEKHGITAGSDRDNHIYISFKDCEAEIDRIDRVGNSIDIKDRFEIKSFSIKSLNRWTNHIVYYLDKCTIFGRIEKDDETALQDLDRYTVAQIDSFLKFAIGKGSTKCAAVLLNYKNEHFADFAEIDEFTLDF